MDKKMMNSAIDPRDLWLASLGVVSLTRKQAAKVYDTLIEEGTEFRDSNNERIDALTAQARAGYQQMKAKVESKTDPLLVRVNETYGSVMTELETRLTPVMELFNSKAKPATKAKPAARKPAKSTTAKAKSAVKKPASKAVSKKVATKKASAQKAQPAAQKAA